MFCKTCFSCFDWLFEFRSFGDQHQWPVYTADGLLRAATLVTDAGGAHRGGCHLFPEELLVAGRHSGGGAPGRALCVDGLWALQGSREGDGNDGNCLQHICCPKIGCKPQNGQGNSSMVGKMMISLRYQFSAKPIRSLCKLDDCAACQAVTNLHSILPVQKPPRHGFWTCEIWHPLATPPLPWPHALPGDAAEPRDPKAAASSAAAVGSGFTQRTDAVAAAWLPAAGTGKGAGAAGGWPIDAC